MRTFQSSCFSTATLVFNALTVARNIAPPREQLLESHLPKYVLQAGAICSRNTTSTQSREILLVMSLHNGRWGIPKGHIELGEIASQTAQREAFEEAGVCGILDGGALGSYIYEKEGRPNRYHVTVYSLEVTASFETFPEQHFRKTRWVPIETASDEIAYTGLRQILERFVFLAADERTVTTEYQTKRPN